MIAKYQDTQSEVSEWFKKSIIKINDKKILTDRVVNEMQFSSI